VIESADGRYLTSGRNPVFHFTLTFVRFGSPSDKTPPNNLHICFQYRHRSRLALSLSTSFTFDRQFVYSLPSIICFQSYLFERSHKRPRAPPFSSTLSLSLSLSLESDSLRTNKPDQLTNLFLSRSNSSSLSTRCNSFGVSSFAASLRTLARSSSAVVRLF
jgi:hypothetical protein